MLQSTSRLPQNLLRPRLVGSENQTQRETPLFDKVSGEVTVTDPTHPLYGQTLPHLPARMNRSTPHVMVLLPTGRRHAIPRAATNLECPVENASHTSPLPAISIRTILPLAHLVHQLKQAKEESHAEQTTSTNHSTKHCSPCSLDDLSSASPEQPTTAGAPGRRTHSARPKSGKRQGA